MFKNAWGENTLYDINQVNVIYTSVIQVMLDCKMSDKRIVEHLVNVLKLSEDEANHTLLFVKSISKEC